MAAKGLSRRPLARKFGFRDEAETQRAINQLIAEVTLLKERVEELAADNARLREGR